MRHSLVANATMDSYLQGDLRASTLPPQSVQRPTDESLGTATPRNPNNANIIHPRPNSYQDPEKVPVQAVQILNPSPKATSRSANFQPLSHTLRVICPHTSLTKTVSKLLSPKFDVRGLLQRRASLIHTAYDFFSNSFA